jgi:hypothetical protein
VADIAQAQVRAGGEIPANRRDSVMKCCWMHELGLTANVLTHLEDGVEGSIPANGRASASMRVRYDCDAPGGAGSGWYASGANSAGLPCP